MGKKRNGAANKLKGPRKWLKGSPAGKKLLQIERDKKAAKKAARLAEQGVGLASVAVGTAVVWTKQSTGVPAGTVGSVSKRLDAEGYLLVAFQNGQMKRVSPAELRLAPATGRSGGATAARAEVVSAGVSKRSDEATAHAEWSIGNVMSPTEWNVACAWLTQQLAGLRCEISAAVAAGYIVDLLKAKRPEARGAALAKELTTFVQQASAAQELAAEFMGGAWRQGEAAGPKAAAAKSVPQEARSATAVAGRMAGGGSKQRKSKQKKKRSIVVVEDA